MNCDISISVKRLKQEKDELGSYSKLAKKYDVNVRYIWELLSLGKMPKSKKVRNKLGIIPQPLEYTRTRRDGLNEIARYFGHASWSAYETAIINTIDVNELIKCRKDVQNVQQ